MSLKMLQITKSLLFWKTAVVSGLSVFPCLAQGSLRGQELMGSRGGRVACLP